MSDNYPPGAKDDPNAPYNKKEPISKRGWWKLTMNDVEGEIDREDESTLEHIGEMIRQGFTEGEIIQEAEPYEPDPDSQKGGPDYD